MQALHYYTNSGTVEASQRKVEVEAMAKRRRRTLDRSVVRTMCIFLKGKRTRTVKDRISVRAAISELSAGPAGMHPVAAEGRLMTGGPVLRSRSVGGIVPFLFVKVVVSYVADPRPGEHLHCSSMVLDDGDVGVGDAVKIIRSGLVM